MSERQKRNIIIGTLCGVLLLMAVGYAAFNTLLTINGTTSITSNWDIKITNITSKGIIGKASDEESQVVDDLSATFKANLVSPGDSITYDITVENKGNINAELSSISMSENTNDSIKIETSGITDGDKLNAGSTATLSVKITYSDEVTKQPDNLKAEVTITLNYVEEGMKKDATAPEVSVTSVTSGCSATSINYTITEKDSTVDTVNIYYKKTNDGAWTSVGTGSCKSGECNYSYNLSVSDNDSREWKVEAINSDGLIGSGSKEASYSCYTGCFVAGTLVPTPNGYKKIEDLHLGDKVYSYNLNTQKLEEKEILKEYSQGTGKLVTINYEKINKIQYAPAYRKNNIGNYYNRASESENKTEIKSTLIHPYYVINKGWTKAKDLKVGDRILTIDGNEAVITRIDINAVADTEVYNFLIEDNHDFYVGIDGLLVHNSITGGNDK